MSRRVIIACSLVRGAIACGGHGGGGADALEGPPALASFTFLVKDNPGLANDVIGTIGPTNVAASTPFGASTDRLVATFAATGEVVVDGVPQISGKTPNDFTHPVSYTVRTASGSQDYVVRVRVPDFAGPYTFAAGGQPQGLAIGDLNGDGASEVVVANAATDANTLSVYANTTAVGASTVVLAPRTDLPTASGPNSVVLADLDGDGRLDLATATNASVVAVHLNTTPPGAIIPTFASHVDFPTGSSPHSIAAGDIDGDGLTDLVTADSQANSISILLNTTPRGASVPSFAPTVDLSAGSLPAALALADLDGNATLDIVVAGIDGTISILLNTPPTFSTPQQLVVGFTPQSIAVADFNDDGLPDIAITSGASTMTTAGVIILLGTPSSDGLPAFAAPITLATSSPAALAVGDLSSDGRPDIAVACGTQTTSVLLDATAVAAAGVTFSPRGDFPAASTPWATALGDLNRDGLLDIATIANGANALTVLVGR